jgi:hypothetical protein
MRKNMPRDLDPIGDPPREMVTQPGSPESHEVFEDMIVGVGEPSVQL